MADAFYEFLLSATDIETMIGEKWRFRPAKAQFFMDADTAKWFDPRGQALEGTAWHYKVYLNPPSGTRVRPISTAVTGSAAEFPRSREKAFLDMSVLWTDLRMFQRTVTVEDYAKQRTKSKIDAIENAAESAIADVDEDFAFRLNAAIHEPQTTVMANIETVYQSDGTAYPDGSATEAYFKIEGGQIGRFEKGMILDVRDDAASVNVQITCVVNDVIRGTDGPPKGIGTTVADIGPGIVVSYYAAEGTGDDSNFDNMEVNINDSGHTCGIVMSGENSATGSFHGLPDWMSQSTDVYRDVDGSGMTRTDKGNAWQIPEIIAANDGGAAVPFDMDTHFRELADVLPYRCRTGRKARLKDNVGLSIPDSLVAITTIRLVNYVVDECKDTQRITWIGKGTDKAARRAMVGTVGFDGAVYHSPSLGTIAFQADKMCVPETLYIIDPSSFFWVNQGGSAHSIEWLKQGSQLFYPKWGTQGRRTFVQEGGAYAAMALVCDQIGCNAKIQDIKSALY